MSSLTYYFNRAFILTHQTCSGWGVGDFLRWWPPSTMWAGPLIFFMATIGDVWIIPSFRIWGYVLYVQHISCVITNCGQHQRHPFSLNSSLCFVEGKHYQEITIPVIRCVLQNFAVSCYFPYILFYRYRFSLLSSDWFVIAVCGSISFRELVVYPLRGTQLVTEIWRLTSWILLLGPS